MCSVVTAHAVTSRGQNFYATQPSEHRSGSEGSCAPCKLLLSLVFVVHHTVRDEGMVLGFL